MTIGLKRKVSLALLPIDDFTDRIITGSWLRVYTVEGNISSIRKPDGYHIFCDLPDGEVEICLEGPLYQKQILKLPVGEEPGIYQVRMLPGTNYPLPQGATIIRGSLPKGSVLRLFLPKQKRNCKLLYDYDPDVQGTELFLFRPYEVSLEGKKLCICGKEKNMEFFRVSDQRGNICVLEHPLSRAYQKKDTNIYLVYESAAGEDGSFYLSLAGLTGAEACVCILTDEDGRERNCEITLTAGIENRLADDVWKEEI